METRKDGTITEVLLERRPLHASLMPGMLELPPLPPDVVENREAMLRLRHSITSTNYYVSIFAASNEALKDAVPTAKEAMEWYPVQRLSLLPLTGLARKVLARVNLYSVAGPETPQVTQGRGRAAHALGFAQPLGARHLNERQGMLR